MQPQLTTPFPLGDQILQLPTFSTGADPHFPKVVLFR